MFGPEAGTCRDLVVQPAQFGFSRAAGRDSGCDDEVAVAVDVPGTQGEGTLQVGADERAAEDVTDRPCQVGHQCVEFFERSKHGTLRTRRKKRGVYGRAEGGGHVAARSGAAGPTGSEAATSHQCTLTARASAIKRGSRQVSPSTVRTRSWKG